MNAKGEDCKEWTGGGGRINKVDDRLAEQLREMSILPPLPPHLHSHSHNRKQRRPEIVLVSCRSSQKQRSRVDQEHGQPLKARLHHPRFGNPTWVWEGGGGAEEVPRIAHKHYSETPPTSHPPLLSLSLHLELLLLSQWLHPAVEVREVLEVQAEGVARHTSLGVT